MEYPESYTEAIENFEIRFTAFFESKGFIARAYSDNYRESLLFEYGKNPYICKPYELLKEARLPILKRKAITFFNFVQAKKALEYIKYNSDYKIEYIRDHLERLCAIHPDEYLHISRFDYKALEIFYHECGRIFIYGYGAVGKELARYFEYRGWRYAGFIVSTKETDAGNVFNVEDIKITADDGIILALGVEAFREVYPSIIRKVENHQLFFPKQPGETK